MNENDSCSSLKSMELQPERKGSIANLFKDDMDLEQLFPPKLTFLLRLDTPKLSPLGWLQWRERERKQI